MQPLHPLTLAPLGDWPSTVGDLHLGDLRAVLRVPQSAANATEVWAPIWWRRRDPSPEAKGLAAPCGLVRFRPTGATTYHVYYLPYQQSGGGASLHFHWYNCSRADERHCAMATPPPARTRLDRSPAYCLQPSHAATAAVVAIESRRVSSLSGRTDFHALSATELIATPEERAALLASRPAGSLAAARVFMEPRERAVRMSDQLQAEWARGGEKPSLALRARAGEFLTFQVGVFAASRLRALQLEYDDLLPSEGAPAGTRAIASSSFSCFNLGGTDYHGLPFTRDFSLAAGAVGSLWVGLDLPASAAGAFRGALRLSALVEGGARYNVSLSLRLNLTQPAAARRGDDDIYSLSRLRWLDSTLGIDASVPPPFVAPEVRPSPQGGFEVLLLHKRVAVGDDGLFAQVEVEHDRSRAPRRALLSRPMALHLLRADGAARLPLRVVEAARVIAKNSSGVYWAATLRCGGGGGGGGTLLATVSGALEYDSFGSFAVSLSSEGGDVSVADVQLELAVAREHGRFMVGMGVEGVAAQPFAWRWALGTGNNAVWVGRAEAGVFLRLRGEGRQWEDPMFSSDFGVIPFIPPSWGGEGTTPTTNRTANGANASVGADEVRVLVFSGARRVGAVAQRFLFDVAATPSKPLNLSRRFEQRYLQVGYNTPYISPQQAAAMGASVVTLHQGIPGLVNGTLVNPYINYPFVPVTVELMENYTSQARALGLRTKFYYTIRELSSHAAELFALRAIGGMLVDGDPYRVPQPGYCHDWDCHGGAAWLHQHAVSHYESCWQQALGDGEWDAAPPHIDGIYYDGINFDRRSMQRVRKVLNQGAAGRGEPLIDIHTGDNGAMAPAATRYLSHFAYAESAWNGEGFDWERGPVYWLVCVSGFIHGIFADRLGGGGYDFKALAFAMYTRNLNTAPHIWEFWRAVDIGNVDMVMAGWWSDEPPVTLKLIDGSCSTAPFSKADPDGASTSVLVTAHVASSRLTVLVIASWCKSDATITLDQVDWAVLGMEPSECQVEQPAIADVQDSLPPFAAVNASAHPLIVKADQGTVLVLRRAN
ncbi:hypothetical protein AB1Y20_003304 [Prymnesium parvum]|uniref:Glycoside hydrolase 123-like N-terminal domain-containing protein n=1 Tax=Prymnesium parvum TaxID=97485 RepID=A0AB34JBM0_PRYPA